MFKRIVGITLGICVFALAAFSGFAIWHSSANKVAFAEAGYVLVGDGTEVKVINFDAGSKYETYKEDIVKLKVDNKSTTVDKESFLFYNSKKVAGLSDGVLLDFNDLSENFVNNYYIPATMEIAETSAGHYACQSSSGEMNFGENLWKLSENKYLIQASSLIVHMGENDDREVKGFVQVNVSEDGIVSMLTPENLWMTFSEDTYIKTANGVFIYPVAQLVTDGKYNISLAKITVSPDDNIVLTEGETRRQIVPQFNIQTIDGKNGADGTTGKTGKTGDWGGDADPGDDVLSSSSTNSVLPTMNVSKWDVTATGLQAVITVKDESGFFEGMQDSAETHPATATITNVKTGEEIACHPVTFTHNYETGEVVYNTDFIVPEEVNFVQVYDGDEEIGISTYKNPLTPDTEYVLSIKAYYIDPQDVTNTIYYREFISRKFFTDSTGAIIKQNYITQNEVGINVDISETYQASIDDIKVFLLTPKQNETFSYADVSTPGLVYIDLNYATKKAILHKASGEAVEVATDIKKSNQEIIFSDLTCNTSYVGRVFVTTSTLETVTGQELEIKTLKRIPEMEDKAAPTVDYNRVTGGFEVYRPQIIDYDNGIVKYKYIVYDSENTIVQTRDVYPSEGEPTVFFLPPGVDYTFGIEMEFYDNEKTVYFKTKNSDPIKSYGTSLPKLELIYDKDTDLTSDSLSGKIMINLTDAYSKLYISGDPGSSLEMNIFADGVYDQSITLKTPDSYQYSKNNHCKALYTAFENSNYVEILVDFDMLCANSKYVISLIGNIDLNDGNGPVRRNLGSVSFTTKEMALLMAKLEQADAMDTGTSIAVKLTIQPDPSTPNMSHVIDELKNGEAIVALYSGTNVNKKFLFDVPLSKTDLEKIDSDGIVITEQTFGSTTINPNSEYTIKIESISDHTYSEDQGYTNFFEIAYPDYLTLNADGVLPPLLDEPDKGVTVKNILNRQLKYYGGSEDARYDEDVLMGFDLQAEYNNESRMAASVTYYAFEYTEFINAIMRGDDPILGVDEETGEECAKKLFEVEIDATDTNKLPGMALLFGNDPQTGAPTANSFRQAKYIDGKYVFYAGDAHATTGLDSGMGRGFRYIFCYTVKYERKSQPGSYDIYPYGYSTAKRGSYNTFRPKGAGTVNGVTIVSDTGTQWYVLNSGMVEAPCSLPTFNTYVYSTSYSNQPSSAMDPATGTITIHYTYDDPDKLIVNSGEYATKITWTPYVSGDLGEAELVPMDASRRVGDESGKMWYSVDVSFRSYRYDDPSGYVQSVVTPKVELTRYNAILSDQYDDLLVNKLGYDESKLNEDVYLCQTIADWSWESYFNALPVDAIKYRVSNADLDKNYYTIIFEPKDTNNIQALQSFILRTGFVKVTAQILDENVTPDVYYLPIEYDAYADKVFKVKISTGTLGAKYFNKTFSLSCEFLYDSGWEGSLYSENKDNFAIQGYSVSEDGIMFGGYSGTNTGEEGADSDVPNYRVFVDNAGTNVSLRMRNAVADQKKVTYGANLAKIGGGASGVSPYLYPYNNGMNLSNNSGLEYKGSKYSLIKKVSAYTPYVVNPNDIITTLTSIVPTMTLINAITTSKSVKVRSFEIYSCEQIDNVAGKDEKILYIGLYKNRAAAEAMNPNGLIQEHAVTILNSEISTEEGGWKYNPPAIPENDITFDDDVIEEGKTYYIAFYAKIEGKNKLLLTRATAEYAIYSRTTLSGVSVAINNLYYQNYGYFDKSLKLEYSLSATSGIQFRYDFYNNMDDANSDIMTFAVSGEGENQQITCTHSTEPLVTSEELGTRLITGSRYYSTGVVTFNMEPGELRTKLQDGGSYVVKMTAYEITGNSGIVVGDAVSTFSLNPLTKIGGVVALQDATEDSIEYLVSIIDQDYILMGNRNYQEGKGLYAVRFTYTWTDPNNSNIKKERLLATEYDDELYCSSGPEGLKQVFELSNDKLLYYNDGEPIYDGQEILPNTQYTIHIFAVTDQDQDAISEVVSLDAEATGHNWEYFFGDMSGRKSAFIKNFLDKFWPTMSQPSLSQDPGQEGVRSLFEIGSATQRTLSAGETYYVNEDYASFVRTSTTKITLRLTESFNIAENNDSQQAFHKIEYSISGYNENGQPVAYSGKSLASRNDALFRKSESYGYTAYDYVIPESIARGRYSITVNLYEGEESTQIACSLSATYTD